jgi:HPt (histidine-containing phosphotransfer) domain-containing protein
MDNSTQQTNIQQLDSISPGDNEFKKELIGIFIDQIPVFTSNMKKFLGENDLINLGKEAHTAKSSVLVFGMTKTGNSLKKIQVQAENKVIDQLQNRVESVASELDAAKEELQLVLDQI